MTMTLKPVPSPLGTNRERLFFLPAGISPTAAAAAIAMLRSPMAMDAAPAFARRRRPARLTQDNPLGGFARADEELSKADLATHELLELLATLAPEQREKAERLLTVVKEQAEMPEKKSVLEEKDEEVAEDEEGETEGMTEEDRRAYEVAIRALEKIRPSAIPGFREAVRDRYGELPKNAVTGKLGGRVHDARQRDERRRQAFDARYGADRIISTLLDEPVQYGTTSAGTMERWGGTHIK
jgi:hypothetical protein